MMRKCNQNTCPVGVATQNPELRKRFLGRSEYLVNYFTFLAQEVREYLAEIGAKSMDEIIGRTDLIVRKADDGVKKHELINFGRLLTRINSDAAIHHVIDQQHGIDTVKDVEILRAAAETGASPDRPAVGRPDVLVHAPSAEDLTVQILAILRFRYLCVVFHRHHINMAYLTYIPYHHTEHIPFQPLYTISTPMLI